MALHCSTTRIIPICWFLFLALSVPLPSCSLPSTQSRKASQKAADKFARWTRSTNDQSERPLLLWVDGNNVRGIGKFEWNAVELEHRVVRFCHKHRIENAIVVWDHGSVPFASSARYSFGDSGTVEEEEEEEGDNKFCVDLLTLFSGLSQRADDVLVKESNHLITTSEFQNHGNPSMKMDWGSLAFVTNDRDLNFKLRRQSSSISPSIRLSRRKRRGDGKVYDASTASPESHQKNSKAVANPLFCDSTGFVELLCDLSTEYDMELSPTEKKASEAIEAAKISVRECSKSQRRGYNPRREKTWERCVQAETLRRILNIEEEAFSNIQSQSSKAANEETSSFITRYLHELHRKRGYCIASQDTRSVDCAAENEFLPFLGPTRLDKHQRRLLTRFNALVRNREPSS